MNHKQEQEKLLLDFLNIHCFEAWKVLPSKRSKDLFVNSLEMMVSPVCNTKCSYCYIKNYTDKLYPCNYDEATILSNCEKIMKWLYGNNYYPSSIEIFSGEFFNLPFWNKYLDIVLNYLSKMEEGYNIYISIPTNATFIFNDQKTKLIESYIEKAKNLGIIIYLSISVDGKYLNNSTRAMRNGKQYDDEFYDKLFTFTSKYNLSFHPMIGPKDIDKWCQNFDWFLENIQKYYNVSKEEALDYIYLLEVRNPDWSDSEIQYFGDFIYHILDIIFENTKNTEEKYNKFYKHDMNLFSSILCCIGRGLGCGLQSCLDIRLGDLALVTCHRTAYQELLGGYFNFSDDKLNIIPENVNSYIFANSFDFKFTDQCIECPISNLCSGPCIGCNYEVNKDLYVMIPTVCKLEISKILFTLKKLEKEGILDFVLKNTCGVNNFKPKKRQIEQLREYLNIKNIKENL